jgi:hypothetical protein
MACIGRNARTAAGDHFGWHPSTGPDMDKRDGHMFINNVLVGKENVDRPLLFVWQPASLCAQLPNSQLNQLDYNVYVRSAEKTRSPLILWSPAQNAECQAAFRSLVDFRKVYPESSTNSYDYSDYDGPLFKSIDLRNYQIVQAFPGSKIGTQIPSEIAGLLGLNRKDVRYVGAYSPIP